jgi:hypothetical protein
LSGSLRRAPGLLLHPLRRVDAEQVQRKRELVQRSAGKRQTRGPERAFGWEDRAVRVEAAEGLSERVGVLGQEVRLFS